MSDGYAHFDPATIARMSRFSDTERCRSLVLVMATSTMARAGRRPESPGWEPFAERRVIPGSGTSLAAVVGQRAFAWSPRSTVQVDIALAMSLPSGSVTSHST